MRNVLEGDGVSLLIPFKLDGDYVVPDVGSVAYTLRDNAGAPVAGHTNVAVTTTTNTTSIPIPFGSNVHTLVEDVEVRTLQVKWQKNGQSFVYMTSYRVVPWANYIVTGHSVRVLLGVGEHELPDEDIDLFAAYMEMDATLGGTILDDALVAGTRGTLKANEAIACLAAIEVLPSLQLRALQRERVEDHEQTRLGNINFRKLGTDLSEKLAAAVAVLTNSEATVPTLFTLGTPTDAITGE